MTRVVLCIVHRCDPLGRAVDKALKDARDLGGELVLASICDAREEELLSKQLSDRSFVGLRLREEITALTCRNAEEGTEVILERAVERCSDEGISVQQTSRNGGFLELTHDLASEFHPSRIFMPKLEQGLFARLVRGDRTDAVVRSLQCPVTIC
jgi:nucleotide-binding universal stress UspA family protein